MIDISAELRLQFPPQLVPDVDPMRSEGGQFVLPEPFPGRQDVLAGTELYDLNVETVWPTCLRTKVLTESTAARLNLSPVAVVSLSQRLLCLPHVLFSTGAAGDEVDELLAGAGDRRLDGVLEASHMAGEHRSL